MHASYHNPLANSEAEVALCSMHIVNGMPSYSIRVDSVRISVVSPPSAGCRCPTVVFAQSFNSIQSRVCGLGPPRPRTAARTGACRAHESYGNCRTAHASSVARRTSVSTWISVRDAHRSVGEFVFLGYFVFSFETVKSDVRRVPTFRLALPVAGAFARAAPEDAPSGARARALPPPPHAPHRMVVTHIRAHSHSHTRDVRGGARGACTI